jgi:hypothetical protein
MPLRLDLRRVKVVAGVVHPSCANCLPQLVCSGRWRRLGEARRRTRQLLVVLVEFVAELVGAD